MFKYRKEVTWLSIVRVSLVGNNLLQTEGLRVNKGCNSQGSYPKTKHYNDKTNSGGLAWMMDIDGYADVAV